METGRFSMLNELATAEKINSSYVSRLLRLTLLAPDIVEAVLDGRQPEGMTLAGLLEPNSKQWERHGRACYRAVVTNTLRIRSAHMPHFLEANFNEEGSVFQHRFALELLLSLP